MSDDLKRCEVIRAGDTLAHFHDAELWSKPENLKAANAAGANKVQATPVAAASLLLALLRAEGNDGPRLSGCYPNANPGLAAGVAPTQGHLFIVGDFLVVDVARTTLRFDERPRAARRDVSRRGFAATPRAGRGERLAATPRDDAAEASLSPVRRDARGYSVEMRRGDAAAATWIFRGDASRRRRGSEWDRPRRSNARGPGSRLRRGHDVDIP